MAFRMSIRIGKLVKTETQRERKLRMRLGDRRGEPRGSPRGFRKVGSTPRVSKSGQG